MLSTGSLGLPTSVGPIYKIGEGESGLRRSYPLYFFFTLISVLTEILHPGVLLLTKMKRWYHNGDSPYPKTVTKRLSDKRDLDYMVAWLAANNMTIEFEKYEGKSKTDLLPFVRYYRELVRTDKEKIEDLQKAMKPGDWALL